MIWVRFVSLVIVLFVVLWMSGALPWLAMATSFLVRQSQREQRALLVLRWKLWMLRVLVRAIGKTETRIGEVER